MKNLIPNLNLLLLLALLPFAFKLKAAPSVKTLSSFQQERAVSNFTGIASGGSLNVQVTLGNKESIRLEGDEDAIADLTIDVIDGILTIKPKTKWNDWSRNHRNSKVTAYISAKKLRSLILSGSGHMDIQTPINSSTLLATLSGSGSITATTNVQSLTGVLNGSGTITLNGRANNTNLTLSGSGTFNGQDFTAQNLSSQISGSATIKIKAEKSIEAVISGSGNISYSGNPTVRKTIIGSGRVTKIQS